MCLDVIHKRKPNPVGKGYKIFRHVRGKLYPMYVRTRGHFLLRRWIKNSDQKIRHTNYCSKIHEYQPGFHIYVNKSDAKELFDLLEDKESYCIKRVEYRKAYISGTVWDWIANINAKTIVAEEMRIQK